MRPHRLTVAVLGLGLALTTSGCDAGCDALTVDARGLDGTVIETTTIGRVAP